MDWLDKLQERCSIISFFNSFSQTRQFCKANICTKWPTINNEPLPQSECWDPICNYTFNGSYSYNLTYTPKTSQATFETYASRLLVQLLRNTTVRISVYGLSHLESSTTYTASIAACLKQKIIQGFGNRFSSSSSGKRVRKTPTQVGTTGKDIQNLLANHVFCLTKGT